MTTPTQPKSTQSRRSPLGPDFSPPRPVPVTPPIQVPESLSYRIKCKVLGKPLHTEQLEHERLGNPTALAVFSSDCISSSAYASEEILHALVPAIGIAAFSLLVPLTVAMLVVIVFLTLSYRQTIKEYPSAGGAYVVVRDNFGYVPAQVAGVALLTDYILTAAVSTAAGVAAVSSAFPALGPYRVEMSLVSLGLICLANLRGLRESGAVFRVPTYFFMVMMLLMFGIGFWQMFKGTLPVVSEAEIRSTEGLVDIGHAGTGLVFGISLFRLLDAFSRGGTATTGVEAISNGIPAFRKPEWRNAQKTLTAMVIILSTLFLGLSVLASRIHIAPYENGYPTVIAEVARYVFGDGSLGKGVFYVFQGATMLILLMAANTAYADFPRLSSFQADDNFMPRQLTKRGHRLQFSNGILVLTAAAMALLIVTGAEVTKMIPLYAIGVFLSFTMSQAGMAKHHIRKKEEGWRVGLVINSIGCALTAIVLVVFTVTKFTHGAWVIVALIPILVVLLFRLNRQYERERKVLATDATRAASRPILRRHIVMVFIDRLDSSTAQAIQYARVLVPDELRAVHLAIDVQRADALAKQWNKLDLSRIPLELVDCPDRRVVRAALETVAAELDGDTEVSVLLPRRVYRRWWHRLFHDSTADRIADAVGALPHANVTTVPFQMDSDIEFDPAPSGAGSAKSG